VTTEPPVTYVETELRRRRRYLLAPAVIVLALLLLIGLVAAGLGLAAAKRPHPQRHGGLSRDRRPFRARLDWRRRGQRHAVLGLAGACRGCSPKRSTAGAIIAPSDFSIAPDEQGRQEDLPIGISKRDYQGVDLVWFNCAVCHTGTYRTSENSARVTVAGMPSNNLDLFRFIRFVLEAGADERLAPDTLIPAMQAAGAKLGLIERQVWRYYVIPRVREGFIQRRSRLQPFPGEQAAWGPGRVDTFNPYKLVQMKMTLGAIAPASAMAPATFPPSSTRSRARACNCTGTAIIHRSPNAICRPRSAPAVTPKSVDHAAIERVAAWLGDLQPPRSPHAVDPAAAERGRALYMNACAACHGSQGADRYQFTGANLGKVEPNSSSGPIPDGSIPTPRLSASVS
jgi:mono/diheme cytochrome c family protein